MYHLQINHISREPIDGFPAISVTTDPDNPEEGYVIIQASDQGLYIEINDQLNSAYGALAGYDAGDGFVTLQLNQPLGSLGATVIRLESEAGIHEIIGGLNEVLSCQL